MKLPFDLAPLPVTWTPVGAAVIVKCWDGLGRVKFACRYTDDLNDAEKHGMHSMALDELIEDLVEQAIIPRKDEDGD